MKSKFRSTYYIAAAVFSLVIAVVLLVLLIGMIKSDKQKDEVKLPLAPVVSDNQVSTTDVSTTDVSSSDEQDNSSSKDNSAAPQRKELDIASIAGAFTLNRAGILEKYGSTYSEYTAGADGSYHAYYYTNIGVAFIFPVADNVNTADTVSWIECDDSITVLGAYESMNVAEATAAWSWEGSWKMQQQGGESAKFRMYMEKPVNGVFVRVYTDWLEGDEQTAKLNITVNKS